jgi:hypothetical protein
MIDSTFNDSESINTSNFKKSATQKIDFNYDQKLNKIETTQTTQATHTPITTPTPLNTQDCNEDEIVLKTDKPKLEETQLQPEETKQYSLEYKIINNAKLNEEILEKYPQNERKEDDNLTTLNNFVKTVGHDKNILNR